VFGRGKKHDPPRPFPTRSLTLYLLVYYLSINTPKTLQKLNRSMRQEALKGCFDRIRLDLQRLLTVTSLPNSESITQVRKTLERVQAQLIALEPRYLRAVQPSVHYLVQLVQENRSPLHILRMDPQTRLKLDVYDAFVDQANLTLVDARRHTLSLLQHFDIEPADSDIDSLKRLIQRKADQTRLARVLSLDMLIPEE
jgi:hypothetical protein